jgi:hypothetical protein
LKKLVCHAVRQKMLFCLNTPLGLPFGRSPVPYQGCQIFRGAPYIPKRGKYTKLPQITTIYNKLPQNTPNGHKYSKWTKIHQHFPLKIPYKNSQIIIFAMKIYHRATLCSISHDFGAKKNIFV